MSPDEMLVRFGYYCGLAERLLNDRSYYQRWWGHADDITEEDLFDRGERDLGAIEEGRLDCGR